MISEWWAALSPVMKILWGITLTASVIFVIQSILTFLGADADGAIDSVDVDFDDPSGVDGVDSAGGANLYTFRNLVNFLLGFGWSAILLQSSVKSTGLLLVISIIVGVALVAAVMYMFKFLSSMQQSGNIDVYKSAIGCYGTCYLAIPAERGGEGKVQITINNAVREYGALTDGEAIPTGTPVTVVEVIDANTLLVEKQNSLII